ncbi:hypothetical protein [Planococcus lenghuensis]|uniref:hypothetical protein n=1 Tax=Planococcus lenghuensis TaxID=2213202 RepID=UPI0012EB7C08|nr:hypothetical protein [Planococcus lenghuensis]
MPSDETLAVFPVEAPAGCILCLICHGRTHRHDRKVRHFRHGYAWHIGTLWIEIAVPRQRCLDCAYTFTYDYGLGLVRYSTTVYRREIVRHCHGRTLSDVACEYQLSYTTVERWFYRYGTRRNSWKRKKRNGSVSMNSLFGKGTPMRPVC